MSFFYSKNAGAESSFNGTSKNALPYPLLQNLQRTRQTRKSELPEAGDQSKLVPASPLDYKYFRLYYFYSFHLPDIITVIAN